MKGAYLILFFAFVFFTLFLSSYFYYQNQSKDFFSIFIRFYFQITIIYFVTANSSYFFILILGFLQSWKKYIEQLASVSNYLSPLRSLKPISILAPCYNEEAAIEASLRSMLALDYPNYEVVLCNDGSTDKSLSILIEKFSLKKVHYSPPKLLPCGEIKSVYHSSKFHNLIVIDKENGGKADALNAAINYSQYPLICCVDSDSVLDSKGLINIALPFLESEHVIATGGTILVSDVKKEKKVDTSVPNSWLGMIQVVEYLRAFLVGRQGWDYLHCNAIISGAFGLFKKSLVIRVGGYETKTIGEDMELLLRMQSYCLVAKEKFKVNLLPTPVCWTETPSDLKSLKNQRSRWSHGLSDCLWRHKNMFFRPWSKSVGMIALPYFLFFEILAAPLEVLGYLVSIVGLSLGVLSLQEFLLFFVATIVFGCILNLGAIIIDQLTFQKYTRIRDLLKMILGAILEHFGFRQLHLYWRLRGIYHWLSGKNDWGKIKRIGIQ